MEKLTQSFLEALESMNFTKARNLLHLGVDMQKLWVSGRTLSYVTVEHLAKIRKFVRSATNNKYSLHSPSAQFFGDALRFNSVIVKLGSTKEPK